LLPTATHINIIPSFDSPKSRVGGHKKCRPPAAVVDVNPVAILIAHLLTVLEASMKQRTSTWPSFVFPVVQRRQARGFRFGIESEYLLVDSRTYRPLGWRELKFEELEATLESIPIGDLPPINGLQPMPSHRKLLPYYVEGYHVPDPDTPGAALIPKGIEIRTPPCDSIGQTLEMLATLHERLQDALIRRGFRAAAISHHPVEDHFEGPQGSRPHDRWQWCMQAMLTFGPDTNISLPPDLTARIDKDDLFAKVNYYGPALAAMSLASPIRCGKPWYIHGRIGKSARTYRRSLSGQAMRFHPAQGGRLEFKSFEMSHRLADFHGYLLLWLALLLDRRLAGRAGNQARVYDLGAAACDGLGVEHLRERAAEVLERADQVLPEWGFDPAPLESFSRRVASGRVPADDLLAIYDREGSILGILKYLTDLEPETSHVSERPEVAASIPALAWA
jgi:carboxylate-amine ligase